MTIEDFSAIKDALTERLASAMHEKLAGMGEEARLIDWFSTDPPRQ